MAILRKQKTRNFTTVNDIKDKLKYLLKDNKQKQ